MTTRRLCEHENDEQKMLVWSLVIASAAVPARTRLGVVCREIAVLMRHVTVRIFWQMAMADMVRLNHLFLQDQQAQALLEWRQDLGSRRSDG